MFTYDGKSYNITVTALSRSFSKLSTDKSGRTQDGNMFIDLIGTYYNYTLTFKATPENQTELGRFWEDISAAKPFVSVSFPYNQTSLTFTAYVTNGDQKLVRRDPKTGKNFWDELTVNFIAKEPARRPTS